MARILETRIDKAELAELFRDAGKELERACVKSPRFQDGIYPFNQLELDRQLGRVRLTNEMGTSTAYSVICEELLEFFEAARKGDRAAARAELVQTLAMLCRTWMHIDDYLTGCLADRIDALIAGGPRKRKDP
jgi:NTP pyrophosphatase (non-canonical NTP hydrolase)